ncbi:allantoinase AllB [Thermogladius sp. 4427co]|uniref:allantoinase AllB n=1 Tax=Thermogladius sp. 4427co TaxID=3450718 RepID=UPI003F7A67D8
MSLIIRNGRIVTPELVLEADIYIEEGIVKEIGRGVRNPGGVEELDARGMLILPGAVDEHVHMREPGLTYKDDFEHGTKAAAAGGVTTVIEMPNTLPPVENRERLVEKAELLSKRAYVDFALYGVLHDGNIDRIDEMLEAGAVGFKVFLGPTTGNIPPPRQGSLYEIMRRSEEKGFTVAFHAEAQEIVDYFTSKFMKEGDKPALHNKARPPLAEVLAVNMVATIQKYAGGRSLIVHVSSRDALEAIVRARSEGVKMYAETCPQYILLSTDDYDKYGSLIKVNPPIREREHGQALLEALNKGLIDTIGSDHAPHTVEEKSKSIWEASSGMPGVQTLLPLMIDLALRGLVELKRIPLLLSRNPARLFGLWPLKGELAVGSYGDIVVVDPKEEYVVKSEDLYYKHKISPFIGWRLKGKVKYTVLRGSVIAEEGEVVDKPYGRWIKPLVRGQVLY